MSLRDWMNNNSAVVTLVAVVVLVIALGFIIAKWKGPGVPRVGDTYFFDLGTEMLFAGKSRQLAPFDTLSGAGNGVRAMVFSCGDCEPDYSGMTIEEVEAAGGFVGWLQKFRDDALKVIQGGDEASEADRFLLAETAQMMRRPEGEKWVNSQSPQGVALMQGFAKRCGGKNPNPCIPK